MSALREVWVIHPPKMKYIQWPIQLHREEETARKALAEHHKVGCDSTLTRETLLTPAHAAVIEAAVAWLDVGGGSLVELVFAVKNLRKLEAEV